MSLECVNLKPVVFIEQASLNERADVKLTRADGSLNR